MANSASDPPRSSPASLSALTRSPSPAAAASAESSPCVLVTGASAGLGLAIAQRLLPTHYRLILTARAVSLARFAALGIRESSRVWIRPLDVIDEQARHQVVLEAAERWGGVDILINNAGIAYRSVVEHASEVEINAQLNVNFLAPLDLVRLVLPGMRAKRSGRIINISSVGGMMAMPTMALYSASKFALEGATESLWYEMRPFGIKVSLIEPGFVHSASFQNTRYTVRARLSFQQPGDPYPNYYQAMGAFIARCMKRARATPEDIARIVQATMEKKDPPLRVRATPDAKLFELARRFFPRQLYHRLLYAALPERHTWGRPSSNTESPKEPPKGQ